MTVNQCQADEITSIVFDSGSSWTRAGYSGENAPKHAVPTVYGKDDEGAYYFGDEMVNAVHKGKEIFSPMADGCVQDWNAVSKLWRYIYDEKLQVDPTEFPLVATEQVWNPLANKQRALEVAFEDLQVPVFSLVKSPLCAAYESARPTALIVDIGSSVVSVTPIVDGSLLHKASFHTRYAGDFLNVHIMSHLQNLQVPLVPYYAVDQKASSVEPGQQASPKLKEFPEGVIKESYNIYQMQRVLNEFKESTLQISEYPLNMSQQQPQAPVLNRPFEFPTGFNLTFGAERLATTEPLFKPSQYPLPNVPMPEGGAQGLGELLYAALSKAPQYVTGPHSVPSEVTTELLRNVVVTGGSAQLTGLVPRIHNEICQWVSNMTPHVYSPPERPTAVWAGASIIASMAQFDQPYWVTKSEYDEFGTNLAEKRFK